MSNQSKDKDVLAAILNVKKYASNLKKKASNLQDQSEDNQITSTPAFFQHRPNEISQLASPMLVVRSSYRQPIETNLRQKKEHSMTIIPGSRKVQKQSRKVSQQYLLQPASPSKTHNPSTNIKPNLSQSYRIQSTSTRLNEGNMWKKQSKNKGELTAKQQNRKIGQKDNLSEINMKLNQTLTLLSSSAFNKSKDSTTKDETFQAQIQIQNPKIVQQLLKQIQFLKSQLNNYKKALIILRTKYLQIQQKCNEKAQSDHLLDVMKRQVTQLEQRNQILNQTIVKQNQKIVNFDSLVIQISKKFMNYYAQQTKKIICLQIENEVYKKLFQMKTPQFRVRQKDKKEAKNQVIKKESKLNQNSSESQSQPQNYQKPFNLNSQLCKKQTDIKNKYNFKMIDDSV